MFVTTSEEFSIIRVVLGPQSGAGSTPSPRPIDRTASGVVRGLLCARCKVGVAALREDGDRLRAAMEYLGEVEPLD